MKPAFGVFRPALPRLTSDMRFAASPGFHPFSNAFQTVVRLAQVAMPAWLLLSPVQLISRSPRSTYVEASSDRLEAQTVSRTDAVLIPPQMDVLHQNVLDLRSKTWCAMHKEVTPLLAVVPSLPAKSVEENLL